LALRLVQQALPVRLAQRSVQLAPLQQGPWQLDASPGKFCGRYC